MAKKKSKSKSAAEPSMGWRIRLIFIFAVIMAAVFAPTSFLLVIGMMPTPFALLVDRSKGKTKVVAVGAMNLAGCSPFVFELWTTGNDFEKSVDIITDPQAIIVIYSAAVIGYFISWAVTGVVASYVQQRGAARQKAIQKRQEEIVQRWGREVTGDIPLDAFGFPLGQDGASSGSKKNVRARDKP